MKVKYTDLKTGYSRIITIKECNFYLSYYTTRENKTNMISNLINGKVVHTTEGRYKLLKEVK